MVFLKKYAFTKRYMSTNYKIYSVQLISETFLMILFLAFFNNHWKK